MSIATTAAAPSAAPIFDPAGPLLRCPFCAAEEYAARRDDGYYWRAFKPLALLGRYRGQLWRVFACQGCRSRFAPRAEVPTGAREAKRQAEAAVFDGAQLVCPKCERAEARPAGRGRWDWFKTMSPPPARRAELATVYRCGDCGHVFAPRASPDDR